MYKEYGGYGNMIAKNSKYFIFLIILGGIVYGLAQTQPGESRGKWQTIALSMIVGGIIVGAIAGAATLIQQQSSGLLTPTG